MESDRYAPPCVINYTRSQHGFRRIGRTCFLGFSPNLAHPSRSVLVDEDLDIIDPLIKFPTQFDGPDDGDALRRAAYPLHSEILTNHSNSILDTIFSAFRRGRQLVREKDDRGFTPLHVAASARNVLAVQALVGLGDVDVISDRDTREGLTPLECCEEGILSHCQLMKKPESRSWLPRYGCTSRGSTIVARRHETRFGRSRSDQISRP
jgi:ankyrin repeat protein